MELARQIAADIGVELEVSDQQFNGLIPALQNGDVDLVLSGMTVTEERKNAVDFSSTYYVGEQPSSFANGFDTYKTAEDLKGKTIGAQLATIQQTIAEEQFPDSELLLLPTVPTLLMELLNGNIEGVVCSKIVATRLHEYLSGSGLLRSAGGIQQERRGRSRG